MILWILLIGSLLALCFLFARRLRMTRKDLLFQDHLAKEEEDFEDTPEMEEEPESPQETEEELGKAELLGTVRKTFLKADTLLSRNEFGEAEPLLLAIIDAEPDHLDAHHKLGLMYMKMGRFADAELYFSKLVNLKQDPVYFSNLGAALYQQQRLVEAAEAYENAIALDDKRGERLQSLAQVYYELGEDEKALHYFERAAKRKPKDLELKMILADYYERQERPEEAMKMLKDVLEADPYNEEVKGRLTNLKKAL